jgi:uncharacterized membrane protein
MIEPYGRPVYGIFSDINDNGEIGGGLVVSEEKVSPAIWSAKGKRTRLTSSKFGGEVLALSNTGYAAGHLFTTLLGIDEATPFGFYDRPYLWKDEEPVELTLPAAMSGDTVTGRIVDVNDDGLAVGVLWSDQTRAAPVVWRDGAGSLLELPEGSEGTAYRVNNAGTIAGTAQRDIQLSDGSLTYYQAPSIWVDGALTTYDLPEDQPIPDTIEVPAPGIVIRGLSESGLILAGTETFSADGSQYATYVYEDGAPTRLQPTDPGMTNVRPSAMSSVGVVVGSAWADDAGARIWVIWEDGEPREISEALSSLPGITVTSLPAINAQGEILAIGRGDDDSVHAVVLRPA